MIPEWFLNALTRPGTFSLSPEGERVYEWWSGRKTLTLYVTLESVEYIRAWGMSPSLDMDDGTISTKEELDKLFEWLDGDA